MELGKIDGNNFVTGTNFKGSVKPEIAAYKPQGRLLAEKEMTDLVHVDNYISSLRGLSNSGLANQPKFDFYVTEDYSKTITDRYGHKRPAVSTLEVINQKTKQPRLITRYIGENLVLKAEYDQQGNMFKKTEYHGNTSHGEVFHFLDGECIKKETF